jgi:ComF family protein
LKIPAQIFSRAAGLLSGFADLLYPPRCAACGELLDPGVPPKMAGLCGVCEVALMECGHPMCPMCGLPYTGAIGPDHDCPECVESPPPFTSARSAFLYGGAAHDAVARFKYGGRLNTGEALIRMALETGMHREAAAVCDAVAPVPLHPFRLVSRGFNQSEVAACAVAKSLGLPLVSGALKRVRAARVQAGLKRRERETNLKGAFAAPHHAKIRGRTILLVDDVMTTGATARECARVLLSAGAKGVHVFTLARTE